MVTREPAVAGSFYSGTATGLKYDLEDLFKEAKEKSAENVIAVISPHAGYIYSGEVSASSFNQLDTNKHYENIFVIGTSHHSYLTGASIYNIGNYKTPLGEVKVNTELASELINTYDFFEYDSYADSQEHSIEVQLPFLQYILKDDFQIVPIIIGCQDTTTIKKIAESLRPYFNNNNLFIISSDFSHYPSYEDAAEADKRIAEAIATNSPDEFMNAINENKKLKITNLATSICGWSSVLTLLYLTENNDSMLYNLIEYKNSGDSKYGDKDRVVGYYSIAVSYKYAEASVFSLSDDEKIKLLEITRSTLEEYLKSGKTIEINGDELTEKLNQNCGAFVTLNKNGELRGCIGRFDANEPLYHIVQLMAIAAATQDPRFDEITIKELDDIEIEISVLSPMKLIESPDEIILGKHGIYIKKGVYSGTYLPQVAEKLGGTVVDFLGHCSMYKAGIGWDGWKDADIYIYEALVFEETDFD